MPAQSGQPQKDAVYFDGHSNRKRLVSLWFGARALEIVEEGTVTAWPYGEIRRVDSPHGMLRLRCLSGPPLARLEIYNETAKANIASRCAATLGAGVTDAAQIRRIVGWSLAAFCSILALVFYGIPLAADRLVLVVPAPMEKRVGEAVDQYVRFKYGNRLCDAEPGHRVLNEMTERIRRAGGIDLTLDVHVLAAPTPNAFALPGGKIYVLSGLIQKAQNPDELAGVIAHELGHVKGHDGMRMVIKRGGTAFLFGLLFGDVTGSGAAIFAARSILDIAYTRDAEQRADNFAVDVMHKLGRSPKAMGELLLRITGTQADKMMISILSNHPLTEDRLAMMRREDRPATGPELISGADWRVLKGICRAAR